MKKITLLLLVTAAITLTAYRQIGNGKTVATSENSNFIYCEMIQQERYIGSTSQETTTFMNYGKKSTYQNRFEESTYIRQQKDGVDALNYLGEKGWDLVVKNVRDISSGIEIVYILKRKAL